MKRIIIFLVCVSCSMGSMIAKDSYYYYKGERVPLSLCEDSIKVYSNESDTYSSRIIPLSKESIKRDSTISSIAYIIKCDSGMTVKMSNRFYVQLFDSINDIQKLQAIARETGSIINRRVPNIPDWYELIINHSNIDNTLEMSNYFYETGLFKEIDPGFIFNFTPSCLSVDSFSQQWALPKIHACDAWNITCGSISYKIAIIDEGIYLHPEFVSTHFVYPYDCWCDSSMMSYYDSHGTAVCGVISSSHITGAIAGMAPNLKIIPISFNKFYVDGFSAQLASGFAWAKTHGADVINCSWGDKNGFYYQHMHSALLESNIEDALFNGRNGKGCVIVFAAGNQGVNQLDYPAYLYPELLTVGATNSNNQKPSFSSYGIDLDVVAPGTNILTTTTYGGYSRELGTSFSAPFVSGIAGLMISVNPNLTRKDVTDIIESTTQKLGGYSYTPHTGRPNGTWNENVGYGLVNAYDAVFEAKYKYIIGLDYLCDTAYYSLNSVPTGATCTWSITMPADMAGSYSIIQGQGTSSICAVRTIPTPVNMTDNSDDSSQSGTRASSTITTGSVNVTITTGNDSFTASKTVRSPVGDKPIVSVSNNNACWPINTTRRFTVINCTNEPDSVFSWVVKRDNVIVYTGSGKLFFYTPSSTGLYTISVTNAEKECGNNTTTLQYLVVYSNFSNDDVEDGAAILDEHGIQCLPIRSSGGNYTLELWHIIYGRLRVQHLINTEEPIDTEGLPEGVYILLLKEGNEIILQKKVSIR